MDDIGAESWLMHKTLLGWFRNGRVMPWDADVTVHVTERSIQHLAEYYNMTVHHYGLPGSSVGCDYLLEIDPIVWDGSVTNVNIKSDGRWLDMTTGVYFNISTLRYAQHDEAKSGDEKGVVVCKDGHRYRHRDIFPLRQTIFEGVPAKVPFAYSNILTEEYGASALRGSTYAD